MFRVTSNGRTSIGECPELPWAWSFCNLCWKVNVFFNFDFFFLIFIYFYFFYFLNVFFNFNLEDGKWILIASGTVIFAPQGYNTAPASPGKEYQFETLKKFHFLSIQFRGRQVDVGRLQCSRLAPKKLRCLIGQNCKFSKKAIISFSKFRGR